MFCLWLFSVAFAEEACADPFADQLVTDLAGARLELDRGVLTLEGLVIGRRVIEAPVVHGDRLAFIEQRDDDGLYDLFTYEASTGLQRRLQAQTPKQLAISGEGNYLAYVNGVTGISSVYVLPFSGGEPIQLTNRALVRQPGKAPVGFTPSPSNGLSFEGMRIVWDGPETGHSVTWGGAK